MAGRPATELRLSTLTIRVVEGREAGRTFAFRSGSSRVGSDPGSDLVLAEPGVSRRHLLLALETGGIRVEDLGSTNGTWCGPARIEKGLVADRTVLSVGSTRLEVGRGEETMTVFPESGESDFHGLVSLDPAMREVFALARQLARTDLAVTISGETGSGKDLLARALHDAGPRRDLPFLVLDCGSVLPELLPSQLFGHERGAFTGADAARAGVLEDAKGGTVFLDEIGELPLPVQPNLLRALEARSVTRLGSREARPVEFRIVSATHRPLRDLVEAGSFRADLYYRLACVTLRLPPLRERLDDLPLLASHLACKAAHRQGLVPPRFPPEALERLALHPWPGNVRELRNAVEALVVLSGGRPVSRAMVDSVLGGAASPSPARSSQARTGAISPGRAEPEAGTGPATSTGPSLEAAERGAIEAALVETGWNRKAAARLLGISPTTIFAKIRRYGLRPPDS